MELRPWLARIPKVELHIHLEGAIPLLTLWQLIEQHGGDPSAPDLAALSRRFVYRDFPHFLATWSWKQGFLRSYADFTLIAEAVARDLARQRIVYAELFYSPPDVSAHGLQLQELTAAIRTGLRRVPEITINLVADLVRSTPIAQARRMLAEVAEVRDQGVIGVGIGGPEQRFPPEPFAPIFAEARRLGLRTSAHAGEAAGPASVWGALRALEVDRIGHATRAIEDPALVAELARRQIPLELCPISNVRTGVIAHVADHPFPRYHEAGMHLTVNTDDPAMFGNSLVDEYAALIENHGATRATIRELVLSAADAAWLPDGQRQALTKQLATDPAWEIG